MEALCIYMLRGVSQIFKIVSKNYFGYRSSATWSVVLPVLRASSLEVVILLPISAKAITPQDVGTQ